MRETLLQYVCCPVDRTPLRLSEDVVRTSDGRIASGTLHSAVDRRYRISDGIPLLTAPFRSAAEETTVAAFGREWARYDDFDGYMGSAELFTDFTGLDRSHVEGRTVLEVGCGGGRWLRVLAALGARVVVGLELSSAVEQAARRTKSLSNVHVVRGSAMNMPLQPAFDLIVSVGVVHHLDDPVLGLTNLRVAAVPDHLVVFWVYAREGNQLYLSLARPLRRFAGRLSDRRLAALSRVLAVVLWTYVHSINRTALALALPLPLRDYMGMLARLRFVDIEAVVYDQLAPQIARYPSRAEVIKWVDSAGAVLQRLHHRNANSWQCHCRFDFDASRCLPGGVQ